MTGRCVAGDENAALADTPSRRRFNMTYALLQTSMTTPPVEALQRAFRSSDSLSAADAVFVADDAFGILARDLPADEAQNIAASLANENVRVDLVAEGDLPRLPDAQSFSSVQVTPDCLRLFNALEAATDIPYKGVRLLAVGYDRHVVRFEIIFGDAVLRFHTTLDTLHFHHNPEFNGRSPGENLVLLVRRIRQLSPHAILNRGAATLCSGAPMEHIEDFVSYPRTSAFFEEMIWLLWRARRSDTEASTETT